VEARDGSENMRGEVTARVAYAVMFALCSALAVRGGMRYEESERRGRGEIAQNPLLTMRRPHALT